MNLLFIGPIFFGYEKIIYNSLKSRYSKVIFKSEVPFDASYKFYALQMLSKSYANKSLAAYNQDLLRLIREESIDRVFIIRGYGLSESFFEELKKQHSHIEIINYQWDSIANNPKGLIISRYADKNYTFDIDDANRYPQFKQIPLFYAWDNSQAEAMQINGITQDIDILFIGGYHSRRHLIVKELKAICESQGLSMYSHVFISPGMYLKNILKGNIVSFKDISFKKVDRATYLGLLKRSRAVLDIQSVGQSGATIRTLETLSQGRKLISTNTSLQREKFYSIDNIRLWSPGSSLEIRSILDKPFDHSKDRHIPDVENWLNIIGI